jgi:fibronectin-binding autotransporter adhesin
MSIAPLPTRQFDLAQTSREQEMNKVHRNIWCEASGTWVAASEITRGKSKSSRSGIVRSIAIGAAAGALLASSAYAVPMLAIGDPDTSSGYQYTIGSGTGLTIDGAIAPINPGSYAQGAPATVESLITGGKLTFTSGSATAANYANYFSVSGNGVTAPQQNGSTSAFDPVTQSNVFFTTYQSAALTSGSYFPALAGLGEFLLDQNNVHIHQGVGLGQVQRTGGALTVNLGDATQLVRAPANTIALMAKNTTLTLADGTGTAASTVDWTSRNRVDFQLAPVVAPETQTMSQVVTQFGGTFATTDGQGNSVTHSVTTPAELAAYNDWLSSQLGTWLVPAANGGEGLTQTQAQQRYDTWIGLALTKETVTWQYQVWTDGGVHNNAATVGTGNLNVISATGANATGRLAAGAALAVTGSNNGAMRADTGAKLINNGELDVWATSQNSPVAIGMQVTNATATNNGVISANLFIDNDGRQNVDSHGAIGIQALGASAVDNAGVVNIGLSTLGQGATGISLAGTSTGTNTGTVNLTDGRNGTAAVGGATGYGVAVSDSASFTNAGTIYIGREAQAAAGASAADVAMSGGAALSAGIYAASSGNVLNSGSITIGTKVQNAAGILAAGTGLVTNDGAIDVLGGTGVAAPRSNIGLLAQDTGATATSAVTNNGTITVGGINNIGLKVLSSGAADAAASTTSAGAINVTGGADPATETRNYGVWVEGTSTGAATVNIDSPIALAGQGAIGVHARSNGSTVIANLTQNATPAFGNTDQIGFFLFGNGAQANVAGAAMGDGGFARTTLFRVADGAAFNGTNGAGGQNLDLTVTGTDSVAVYGTGAGTSVTTANATFHVGAIGNTGTTAVKIEGGATGNISDSTQIILDAPNTIAAVVDGQKHTLGGADAGAPVATTLNSGTAVVSALSGVTGYVTRNLGAVTLDASSTLALSGADSVGVDVQQGGRLTNDSTSAIQVGGGVGVRASGNDARIERLGQVNVDGGVAGVQLLDGAMLTVAGSGNVINTKGTANGILLDTGAAALAASNLTINSAGSGAGIENKAEIGTVKLTGVTINAVDGAAIRTATSFDASSTAALNVAGAGTGIAFRNFDGSTASGDLDVGPGYQINVLPASNGGTGIDARTTGNVSTAGSIDVLGANGGAAVVAHDAASITNTGTLNSVSTVAPVIDGSGTGTGTGKTITNSGTVTALNNAAVAIQASTGADTVNLIGGAVRGVVNTGDGSDKFVWTSGTLDGEVNMGNGAGNSALVGAVDLSTTRHILTGSGAGSSIEFSGTTGNAAKVGTLGSTAAGDDLTRGTNIGAGWNQLAATNGADVRIVDTLQLAGAASEIKVASNATLRVGGAGATAGDIANHDVVTSDANGAGTLVFDNLDAKTYGGVISGSGNFLRDAAGTTYFTADNTYTGTTTINSGGTLQFGADVAGGAATGGIAAVSAIVDNGALVINRNNTLTLAGAISGSGTLTQQGSGVTDLRGDNSYAGATAVSAGALLVNGNQSAATGATTVATGATLGGAGTIGGSVAIDNGAILAPGMSAGSSGTLGINGSLGLASGSLQNWQFGQAYVAGGAYNDLVNVGGDLVLDGTLNVSVPATPAGGSFGPGVYRVYNYGGALTDNGLAIGSVPAGGSDLYVQTSVANQVNLVNTTGVLLNYWDGPGGAGGAQRNNGAIEGGSGVWQLAVNDNWTNMTGQMNAPWSNNAFSIFQGLPGGTVTVSNANGQVMFSGAQFAVDGYRIAGDALMTDTARTVIRVGDGTLAGLGYTATYDNTIAGSGGIDKADLGTLVLNGTNTYGGGTTVSGGTLQVSADRNLGAAGTGVTLDGGTLKYGAGFDTARQVTLGANNGTIDSNGNAAMLSTDVTGSGKLTKTGAGTLTLTADNSYTGGTAIANGTLQLGNGGTTGSIHGDVSDNGVLVVDRTNTLTLDGKISGMGALQQVGSGSTVLAGANNYSGSTTVASGTLKAGVADTFSAASAHTVAAGATLDTAGTRQTVAALNNAGTVSLVSGTPGSTLTVNGNYIGQGGTLKLGTQVGTNGVSDRLVINGANASANGRTVISVTDIGGLGGATTGNGIELVTATNGATTTVHSSKDAFALAGDKILAGAFDYRLVAGDTAGGGENWYLRSNFRSDLPLYSALPNLVRQGDLAMLGNLHRRIGDDDLDLQVGQRQPSGWGGQGRRAWGRIIGGNTDVEQKSSAVDTDAHSSFGGFQTGVDLYADDNWSAGVYIGILRNDARVNGLTSAGAVSAGTARIDSHDFGTYATYTNADRFYADMVLQYGMHDVSPAAADGRSPGVLDAHSTTASIEIGQPFPIGGNWTIEPQAQLIYQRSHMEGGAIAGSTIEQDPANAVIGRLGFRLKGDMATPLGRLQPYARVNLWHGFSGHDTTRFAGPAATTAVDSSIGYTSIETAAGFTLKLTPTTSVYGEVGHVFKTGTGEAQVKSSVQGSVGVKLNF